jgi:deoxyribonuclease V
MEIKPLHRWDVSASEAFAIQQRLRGMVSLEDAPNLNIPDGVRLIAGVDMSASGVARAAVVLLSFPELELIEAAVAERPLDFPYIPGLLSFREAPAILAAFEKLRQPPDLVMFDGQGIAHPRRFGIASHIGVILDIPSFGCAKSLLRGKPQGDLDRERGAVVPLIDKGEEVGAAVRTRDGVSPVYISPGTDISTATAVRYTLAFSTGKYRLPQPTRLAHNTAALPSRR